jgi:hypothetical protein
MCKGFLKAKFPKHKVALSLKSDESGVRSLLPYLLRAVRTTRDVGRMFVVAKVDRLSRHYVVFYALLPVGVPIYFAEFPSLGLQGDIRRAF